MSKKSKVLSISTDNIDELTQKLGEIMTKPAIITNAIIKEEQCNYGYEIMTGPCKGDKVPNRKGSALVHEDMNNAFAEMDKHLAYIDDAFSFMKKAPGNIDELAKYDEIIGNFKVVGFKVNGSDENEGFILIGDKYVNLGSIGLETPKISKSSGYQFFDELQETVENCRTEVEAYMNGKCTPKMEQGSLDFDMAGADGGGNEFDNPIED